MLQEKSMVSSLPRAIAAAAIGLAMLTITAGVAAAQTAGPPEIRELPALRAAPNIPVVNISARIPSHAPGRAVGAPDGMPGGGGGCDKDVDLVSTISGLVAVGALDTGICSNSDIDAFVGANGRNYVVIAGGNEAAWTQIDVTNPASPTIVGQFVWSKRGKGTYTPDVKAFVQGSNDYIVLGLERSKLTNPCGVVIVNVSAPGNPVIESQTSGSDWCDVHNVFVENEGGQGAYIYVTADNSADLRVLDIRDAGTGSVDNPAEVGRYFRQDRGFGGSGFLDDIYVHDVTVVDGTVYVSYWLAGLDIFSASLVKSGTINENNTGVTNIDPPDFDGGDPFLTHHAFPTQNGDFVFLEDEIASNSGDEPVQMWNTSSGMREDGLALGTDIEVNPAHNLEINFGINPTRLYTGWYRLGLQAFDFDLSSPGFTGGGVWHQAQTEANDDDYSGAWGVRLATIGGKVYAFQSDRNFGLIVDCHGDTALCGPTAVIGGGGGDETSETGTIKGTASSGGVKLADILVEVVETLDSATTNNGGKYNVRNVVAGTGYTVEATDNDTGRGCNITTAIDVEVVAGGTTTIDFAMTCP